MSGAQLSLGNAWIMLKKVRPDWAVPRQLGYATQSFTAFVEDIDAHFKHSQPSGARIVEDLQETVYGERPTS